MKSPKKQPKVKLDVRATLELDPADFQGIDEVSLDEVAHIIEAIMETTARVQFHKAGLIRGVIRFIVPRAYDLKVARLKSLGEPVEGLARGAPPPSEGESGPRAD